MWDRRPTRFREKGSGEATHSLELAAVASPDDENAEDPSPPPLVRKEMAPSSPVKERWLSSTAQ